LADKHYVRLIGGAPDSNPLRNGDQVEIEEHEEIKGLAVTEDNVVIVLIEGWEPIASPVI
jgi:hypothetical protein